MTKTQIDLLLRIYDKCLRYGQTDPNLKYAATPRKPKELFKEKLNNNEILKASYIFSRETDSKAREVFLYYAFRLNFLNKKEFADLLISTYNMTDSNTSFFTFYSYDTIIKMFSAIDIPYLSQDEWNDFSSLSNVLTIYRGLKTNPVIIDRCGFSWTLKKELAINFAFQSNRTHEAFLVSGQIDKNNILAYLTHRVR